MEKIEALLEKAKLNDLLNKKNTVVVTEKKKPVWLWVLAIIGAVAAIAGIVFFLYKRFAPCYEECLDDDFDDFDDEDEEDIYEDESVTVTNF